MRLSFPYPLITLLVCSGHTVQYCVYVSEAGIIVARHAVAVLRDDTVINRGVPRDDNSAEDHRSPLQLVLRAGGDPAGGTEWFPTEPFYHRYDVCDSSVTGAGVEETNAAVYVCFIDLTKAYDSVDRTLL